MASSRGRPWKGARVAQTMAIHVAIHRFTKGTIYMDMDKEGSKNAASRGLGAARVLFRAAACPSSRSHSALASFRAKGCIQENA